MWEFQMAKCTIVLKTCVVTVGLFIGKRPNEDLNHVLCAIIL